MLKTLHKQKGCEAEAYSEPSGKSNPVNIHLFQDRNGNTRKRCEIC